MLCLGMTSNVGIGVVRTELRIGLQTERVQASIRVLAEVMRHRHEAPLSIEDPARDSGPRGQLPPVCVVSGSCRTAMLLTDTRIMCTGKCRACSIR